MTPIPAKIRRVLEKMPRMKMCEIGGHSIRDISYEHCEGKIEWHHVFIYQGRQVQEVFSILGICHHHHTMVKTNRKVKEALERRSLEIATDVELARYPKKDWAQLKEYLNVYEKNY